VEWPTQPTMNKIAAANADVLLILIANSPARCFWAGSLPGLP